MQTGPEKFQGGVWNHGSNSPERSLGAKKSHNFNSKTNGENPMWLRHLDEDIPRKLLHIISKQTVIAEIMPSAM